MPFPKQVNGFSLGATRATIDRQCRAAGGNEPLQAGSGAPYFCSVVPEESSLPVRDAAALFCSTGLSCEIFSTIYRGSPKAKGGWQALGVPTIRLLAEKYGPPQEAESPDAFVGAMARCFGGSESSAHMSWIWPSGNAITFAYSCFLSESGEMADQIIVVYSTKDAAGDRKKAESRKRGQFLHLPRECSPVIVNQPFWGKWERFGGTLLFQEQGIRGDRQLY